METIQNSKCRKIIHTAAASAAAAAAGLAQIPGSDAVVITPIQITMIIALGGVFDIPITKSGANSILAAAIACISGRTVTQFLVGWIPGIGNAINASTAFVITEGIGWYAAKEFDKDRQDKRHQDKDAAKIWKIVKTMGVVIATIVAFVANVVGILSFINKL
ncbi:hypothetical protein AGMMS50276_31170 [Synergistales bacterium]|nr:hypothetical protein AGMMS50276_31170 [Synergistales bacterium]